MRIRTNSDEISTRGRWALLITVGAGLLLITLDNSILYTALPTLERELGASGTQGLWIINAYPLVMVGLLLGTGTLGDRVGHAKIFTIGLVIFGVASTLAAFSPDPETLIVARAVLAVGAAAMMPATLALIRTNFLIERERNFAIAVWGSMSVVGSALGPILGGVLLHLFWWGSVFLINVPVVIATLVSITLIKPRNDPNPRQTWDFISSVQGMIGLVALVVAIKNIGHLPQSSWTIMLSLVIATAGISLFVRRQHNLDQPLLEFSLFRNHAFSAGVAAAVLSMFTIAGLQLATTQRLQLVAGFSPMKAGLLVATIALGSLPTALLGGAFLHRIGLRVLISGGFAASALGIGMIAVGFYSSMAILVIGLLITGAGLGSAMSVASTAIIGNASARHAGMASSVKEVSYEFGSLTAVAVLGTALQLLYSSTVSLPRGAPESARGSLLSAMQIAGDDERIINAATRAFDHAYISVVLIAIGLLIVGTVVTGSLLGEHGPGSASQTHPDS